MAPPGKNRFQNLSPAAQYGRMINQGQAGGIKSIAPGARAMSYTDPVERVRAERFDNRQDVSRDRLERSLNQRQANLLDRLTMFKPVTGSSNLLQSVTPGGPTIAETQSARARQFGPTFPEIMSDVNFAVGQIGQGLAEKGTPFMNLMRGIGQAAQNFVQPIIDSPAVQSGIGFFDDVVQKTRDFNAKLMQLTPAQRRIYDQNIIIPGTTPQQAYNKAVGMAMGGIATLQ